MSVTLETASTTIRPLSDIGLASEVLQLVQTAKFDKQPFSIVLDGQQRLLRYVAEGPLDGRSGEVLRVETRDMYDDAIIVILLLPTTTGAKASAIVMHE